jgi:hypothetical protein
VVLSACDGFANVSRADFFVSAVGMASAFDSFAFVRSVIADFFMITIAERCAFDDLAFWKTVFSTFFSIAVGKTFGRRVVTSTERESIEAMILVGALRFDALVVVTAFLLALAMS